MTTADGRLVRPSYGALRRCLLPIYGLDQLLTVVLLALPVLWLSSVDLRLAIYTDFGAYAGVIFVMKWSTPATLLLTYDQEHRMTELLDSSRRLTRTGNTDEWISTRGRLRRWDTDTIRLTRTPDGVMVTGGIADLHVLAQQLGD